MPAKTRECVPAGLAGTIFVCLSASAFVVVPQMPPAGAQPGAVLDYIEANQRALEWTWFLAGEVAWLFGIYFCAALTVSLWTSSPFRAAALAGMGGAVVTATLTISAGIPWGLLIYLGPQLISGDLVLTLAEARHFADAALSFSTAAMLLGFSISVFGARGNEFRFLMAAGLVATASQLVHGTDDFLTYGETGILPRIAAELSLAWILAASLLMLTRASRLSVDPSAGRSQVTQTAEARAG
jgi:hypothetical protein